jgi:hypothetical protein
MSEIQIWSRPARRKRLELQAIIRVEPNYTYIHPVYAEIDVSPLFKACQELLESGEIGMKKTIGDIEYFLYYFPHDD